MKTLVLAEKPSVGRELARVLGCSKTNKSYIEGDRYVVTWAMGHLVELADPAAYDNRYGTWSLDYLPMLPDRMKHRVIGKTSGQFRAVKGLFSRKDVDRLIIATDAGREGELVARWIMRLGGWKGTTSRLWISSQTDTAIREGFERLRPGKDYENLFRAAESRAAADWIIGLNLSRALSCKHDARLSAGRVQTPTLALIAGREEEIRTFISRPFWNLWADFGDFRALWCGTDGNTRFFSREKADAAVAGLSGASGRITDAGSKEKREGPPQLFDLTALQREANAALGFSAKRTLDILQGLYERHKVVTYPRTDSRYITPDIVPTLKGRLQALAGTVFGKHAGVLARSPLQPGKRVVSTREVSDHHALIPTEQPVIVARFNPEERALWEMIVRRFIEALMPDHRYRVKTVEVEAAGMRFRTREKTVTDPGWRIFGGSPGEEEEEDIIAGSSLERYNTGDVLEIAGVELREGRTKPPAYHTEGTLLAAMENPGHLIEDVNLRRSIASCGLGTPATRAEIIEKLIRSYYIERRGRELHMTSRGMELLDLVPDEIKSPSLTAQWELRLKDIEQGREAPSDFDRDIRRQAIRLVEEVKGDAKKYTPRGSGKSCPLCGRVMIEVMDKKGKKVFVCQALSCGYEESQDGGRDGFMNKPTARERAISRKLMHTYGDTSGETSTFADLLNASSKRKEDRGGKSL